MFISKKKLNLLEAEVEDLKSDLESTLDNICYLRFVCDTLMGVLGIEEASSCHYVYRKVDFEEEEKDYLANYEGREFWIKRKGSKQMAASPEVSK